MAGSLVLGCGEPEALQAFAPPAFSAPEATGSGEGSAIEREAAKASLQAETEPVREPWRSGDRCQVPDAYRPWSWSRLTRVRGLGRDAVVFTVDGGHSLDTMRRGLDVLRAHEVRATYFLTTSVLAASGDEGEAVVKRLVADGHELGNHTVDHPRLTNIEDDDAVRQQLIGASDWVQSVSGHDLRPFFRAPYLDMDERVSKIARRACFRSVWISRYTKDDLEGVTADDIVQASLDGEIERGSIYMFHASNEATVTAWPRIIAGLRERGFAILPLDAAVRERAARHRSRRSAKR